MKNTAFSLMLMLALSLSALTGVQTAKSLTSKDLFDVDLLYAYVQPGAPSAVAVLNFTDISNLTLPLNSSITEVYTMRVLSKDDIVGSEGAVGAKVGWASYNGSFLMQLGMGFGHFSSGGEGVRFFEVTYEPLNPSLVEPIALSLVKLGWITVEGDNTQTNFSLNETVADFEMSKYKNGFLYNALFSQDELSKIDLFEPFASPNATSPEPTPTMPNTGPTQPPPYFDLHPEFVYLMIMLLVVIAVGFGFCAYFMKLHRDTKP